MAVVGRMLALALSLSPTPRERLSRRAARLCGGGFGHWGCGV